MELLIETSVGFFTEILTFIIIILLTWLFYRKTEPNLENKKKIFLASLRFISFSLLFFLLYKFIFLFYHPSKVKQKINIIFDNSSSMKASVLDMNFAERINPLINSIGTNPDIEIQLFTLGDSIKKIESIKQVTFSDKVTNLGMISSILSQQKANTIASVLISDGRWNTGISPLALDSEMGHHPVYCIGVGDTNLVDYHLSDIDITGNIFLNTKNKVSVKINRNFYKTDTVHLLLMVNKKNIQTKQIVFDKNEIGKQIEFNFIPDKFGKGSIDFQLSSKSKELNFKNNNLTKDIIVYKNKYNFLIMGGVPNPDIKKIKNLMEEFSLIKINLIYDIIKTNPPTPEIPDGLLLWGFPGKNSNSANIYKINNMLVKNDIPVWVNLTEETEINSLKRIMPFLKIKSNVNKTSMETNVFPMDFNKYNSIFEQRLDNIKFWELIPPVKSVGYLMNTPKEDNVVLWGKMNNRNFPLIKKIKNKNSIFWLSDFENIWRWHSVLVYEEKFQNGLRNFIKNIIFSLVLNELDSGKELIQFEKTNQINYPLAATNINVKIFENDLNLMQQTHIKMSIEKENKNIFLQEKYGIQPKEGFKFSYNFPTPGNYKISAKVYKDSVFFAQNQIDYYVADKDIEQETTSMNKTFLNDLADKTRGDFYNIKDQLNGILDQYLSIKAKPVLSELKIIAKDNFYILFILLILLNIEWFFRKRWGLL